MSINALQCNTCSHAKWRGREVVACQRFDDDAKHDATMAGVLEGVLFTLAAMQPCAARDALVFGPDAYRAEDLPAADDEHCTECTTRRQCSAACRCLGEQAAMAAWPGELQRQMEKDRD